MLSSSFSVRRAARAGESRPERRRVRRSWRARIARYAVAAWLPVTLIGLWAWTSRASADPFYPPLADILDRLREQWLVAERLTEDILPSLMSLVAGLALATAVGVGLGTSIGLCRPVRVALAPFLDLFRSLPGLALMPIFVLVFGIGSGGEIALIAFACLWPILLNTIDGVAGIDPGHRDVTRSLRLGRLHGLRYVILPGASRSILAGVNLSIAIGVIFMIAVEMFSSSRGVGYQLILAQRNYDVPASYAGAIVGGLLGYLLAVGAAQLERRVLLRWHFEQQEASSGGAPR
ncbi:Binding-protein-dependent transport systems inner membrane component [Patulibacter medicamentivorans]|uniref:Binding-protein-dependent transport systems inner membrane component n=1 Tax=Patulibacter medicamentivorans TaxID=1097667 RepID=H0E065_9ACTN|nr:ABC transporter permease [Patulibacter medicamentivorans]EHN12868.1 Binding-protein-dependent transport systems inner membrane component [Patulibacter medicamentivorans]